MLELLWNLPNVTFFFNISESLLKFNYTSIFTYLMTGALISFVIINFSILLVIQNPETEKLSSYECGFEPYEDARHQFDVKFYLIAILFVIFDIETMFLLPWSICLAQLNSLGFWAMLDFIIELSVGFVYIWYIGGLKWKSVKK